MLAAISCSSTEHCHVYAAQDDALYCDTSGWISSKERPMLQAADAQRVRARRKLRVQRNRLWCRTPVIARRVSRMLRCIKKKEERGGKTADEQKECGQLQLRGVSRSVLSDSPCSGKLCGFQGGFWIFVGACRSPVEVHDHRTIPFPHRRASDGSSR
jgi:hypothetical protein